MNPLKNIANYKYKFESSDNDINIVDSLAKKKIDFKALDRKILLYSFIVLGGSLVYNKIADKVVNEISNMQVEQNVQDLLDNLKINNKITTVALVRANGEAFCSGNLIQEDLQAPEDDTKILTDRHCFRYINWKIELKKLTKSNTRHNIYNPNDGVVIVTMKALREANIYPTTKLESKTPGKNFWESTTVVINPENPFCDITKIDTNNVINNGNSPLASSTIYI
jgi:hypothetical protein